PPPPPPPPPPPRLDPRRTAAALPGDKPWFAIGGIDAQRLPEVLDAGARRVVVVRAITVADDPRAAAEQLKAALTAAR
ncbi:thiamine phosphate synthase, partial [Mycobacterium talmoniae]|uniref:thiamine phosphate synthase n=1 Tax=Mycobacterium talmoniae TaxID=1858794 RepID=UPI000AF2644E